MLLLLRRLLPALELFPQLTAPISLQWAGILLLLAPFNSSRSLQHKLKPHSLPCHSNHQRHSPHLSPLPILQAMDLAPVPRPPLRLVTTPTLPILRQRQVPQAQGQHTMPQHLVVLLLVVVVLLLCHQLCLNLGASLATIPTNLLLALTTMAAKLPRILLAHPHLCRMVASHLPLEVPQVQVQHNPTLMLAQDTQVHIQVKAIANLGQDTSELHTSISQTTGRFFSVQR